jgi:hypothetical protein
MGEDCSWIYSGWDKEGNYTDEWMDKGTTFLDRAFSFSKIMQCPCSRYESMRCLEDKTTLVLHLCKNGFVPVYEVWKFHIESGTRVITEEEQDYDMGVDRMDKIPEAIQEEVTEDPPTMEVEVFFKLLKASEESLHEHTEVTLLAFITWLMVIKSKYFFSNNSYKNLMKLISDILLKPHKVPKDMYRSKKLMFALVMKYGKMTSA